MLLLQKNNKELMTPVLWEGLGSPGPLHVRLQQLQWRIRQQHLAEFTVGVGSAGGKDKDQEWNCITKLSCLVKDVKIKSLEGIYTFPLPIYESESLTFSWGLPSRTMF